MNFCTHVRRAARLFAPQENHGVAAVEFAIYALVFLTMVAATVDIGLLLFTQSQLDAAVSAGAEYAANSAPLVATNPTGLSDNISSIVNYANTTVVVNNNDTVTTDCYCPTGSPGNWTWGSSTTCTTPPTACPGGSGVYGQFVTITATTSISPIFSGFGFVKSGTISRSALVETQ
jgi:Flp pilus assembly protein TadG